MVRSWVSDILTAEELRRLLDYNPLTGVFMWRERKGGRPVGVAGGLREGRWVIRIGARKYQASRLAWLYMTDKWPTPMVDHQDCDKLNNRFDNLREANWTQNNSNKPTYGSVGLKGVTRKGRKFLACIARKKLGVFDCPAAAHFAYVVEAVKTYGEFAKF